MPSANEEAEDRFVGHTIDLLSLSETMRIKVVVILEKLQDSLAAKLAEAELGGPPSPAKVKRAKQVFDYADQAINTAYRDITELLGGELLEFAEFEATEVAGLINKVLHAELASPIVTKKTLEVFAKNPLIQGAKMDEWWNAQSRRLRMRFSAEVRMGYMSGETTDDIVRRIIGKATGQRKVLKITKANGKEVKRVVVERTGGIMNATKHDATTLVRTAVQTVSNQILNETYDENDDVIKGKRAVVTLDGKTSPTCRGRAGAAWFLNGKPMPESPYKRPFPGPPPWHMRCRTVLAPILKSWDELAGTDGKFDEIPAGTRASMDGQVPTGNYTYEQWFKTKPESFQRKVLGPGRYDMWKLGKATMVDMIDPSGRPLTLTQLKERK